MEQNTKANRKPKFWPHPVYVDFQVGPGTSRAYLDVQKFFNKSHEDMCELLKDGPIKISITIQRVKR